MPLYAFLGLMLPSTLAALRCVELNASCCRLSMSSFNNTASPSFPR